MPKTILTELSHFGLLRFSGADARAFLHSQLSCDVEGMLPWEARYGSYNTPKGRMLASFLLWHIQDDAFQMQLPLHLCAPILAQLKKFVLRSKVEIYDISGETTLLGIAGIQAGTLLHNILGTAPDAALRITSTKNGNIKILKLDDHRFIINMCAEYALVPRQALEAQTKPVDHEAWELMDIRAGIPYVLPSTQDQFVPQMANLDLIGGISFTKGCYPGQEIVARTHYLGKLKQRMYWAHIDSAIPPHPYDKIFSQQLGDQASGHIINAAPSPEGGYEVLAVMQIDCAEHNDARWDTPEGPALQFKTLPYALTKTA